MRSHRWGHAIAAAYCQFRIRWLRWRYDRRTTITAIAPAFDAAWYLSRNPDVRGAGVDPVAHYVEFGYREGRDPHPLFDTDWYLSQYQDVAGTGLNPLVHYLRIGWRRGYDPSPLFNSDWYTAQNPDVLGGNPLLHFIRHGGPRSRDPHPLFRSKAYAAENQDTGPAGAVPLIRLVTDAADLGWRVKLVDHRFAPCLAIGVRHKDDREDAWFFDSEMRRIPDRVESWSPEARAALNLHLPAARSIWRGLVCAVQPNLDEQSREICENGALFRNGDDLLLDCLRQWRDEIGLASREIVVGDADTQPYACSVFKLRADLLRELLTFDEAASPLIAAALTSGTLSCRSPVDGRELKSDGSLVLSPQLLAYRFVDPAHDLVFYIISPILGWAQARVVYIPQQRMRFVSPGWSDPAMETLFGAAIELLFARHVLSHALDIESYLQSHGPRTQALVFIQANIAHHLWNELGELDRLAAAGAVAPEIILLDGARNEHFGPIDALFPQYQGRMQRSVPTAQLAHYIYRRGLCLFGPTSKYVTARLRSRVKEYNAALGPDGNAGAIYDEVAKRGPIVVVGLRSHNRTLVNFAEVCAEIARFILQEAGHVTLVFDGWGAKGIPEYVLAEKEIVTQFNQSVQHPNVRVIDLIGRPMAESLFWVEHSDFFVSVYGAGLTKYRWLGNKPGLLLTGRWNLRHRGDLRIYDSDEFMEARSPMIFISETDVQDAPEAKITRKDVLHPGPSQINFRVNTDAVLEHLRDLLQAYGSRERP